MKQKKSVQLLAECYNSWGKELHESVKTKNIIFFENSFGIRVFNIGGWRHRVTVQPSFRNLVTSITQTCRNKPPDFYFNLPYFLLSTAGVFKRGGCLRSTVKVSTCVSGGGIGVACLPTETAITGLIPGVDLHFIRFGSLHKFSSLVSMKSTLDLGHFFKDGLSQHLFYFRLFYLNIQ